LPRRNSDVNKFHFFIYDSAVVEYVTYQAFNFLDQNRKRNILRNIYMCSLPHYHTRSSADDDKPRDALVGRSRSL